MRTVKEKIIEIAEQYNLQLIYAFGSRAEEALMMAEGKIEHLSEGPSDLDIGLKPQNDLTIEEKVEITLALEEVFDIARVDLVVLSESPVFLSLRIVTAELLYARDTAFEAEYQLYIMRKAAELIPYERMKEKMVLGV